MFITVSISLPFMLHSLLLRLLLLCDVQENKEGVSVGWETKEYIQFAYWWLKFMDCLEPFVKSQATYVCQNLNIQRPHCSEIRKNIHIFRNSNGTRLFLSSVTAFVKKKKNSGNRRMNWSMSLSQCLLLLLFTSNFLMQNTEGHMKDHSNVSRNHISYLLYSFYYFPAA